MKTKKAAPTRLGTSPQRASSRIASLQSPRRKVILRGLAASNKRRAPKGTCANRLANRGPDFPHVLSPVNHHAEADHGMAEVRSVSVRVCDWARVGLCQIVGATGPTLVECQFAGGCDCVLHHLCQTEWESKDETGQREAHGTRKLCALHHPALRLFDVSTPKACSDAAMADHNEAIITMQGKNSKKKGTLKGASATNSIAIDVDDNSTNDVVGTHLKRSGETIEPSKPPSTTYNNLSDSSDDEDIPFLHEDKDDPDWRNSEIFNDDSEDSEGDDYYRVPSARGGGSGRKSNPGRPPKPNTDGMSPEEAAAVIHKWRLDWKRQRDLHRRTAAATGGRQDFDVDLDMSSRFTGICNPLFRTMVEVYNQPLLVGHTFPTKELVLMRIAEEANLFGVRVGIKRSDHLQIRVHAYGDPFHVHASYGTLCGWWTVTKCQIRLGRKVYVPKKKKRSGDAHEGSTIFGSVDDIILDESVHDEPPGPNESFEDIFDDATGAKEGDADEDEDDSPDDHDDTKSNAPSNNCRNSRAKSPIKCRWLVPILKTAVVDRPGMSNKDMRQILKPYVIDIFMTPALLQLTRTTIRRMAFGDPEDNIKYLPELVRQLQEGGHDFTIWTKTPSRVLQKVEEMMLGDYTRLMKAKGVKLTQQDKYDFLDEWKSENRTVLEQAGVLDMSSKRQFVSGIFLSLAQARGTVPLLQNVYQADAAHTNFGKYTLYSCYGIDANSNTFPVALALIFGNEDKEGWVRFWEFVKNIHGCVNRPITTVITDQQKGSIEAMKEVIPQAVNFFCSYHRKENIRKVVKGGSGEYSCSWFYNKLLGLKLPHSIEIARSTDLYHMDTRAVAYLNKVPDHQQYPASRCALTEGVCMFMRTASSAVESMNRANASVRERTAVDPINACILLLKLEGERFGKHRDLAHKHSEILTPHGMKLMTKAFKDVNPREFEIYINPQGDRLSCRVNRIISPNIYTCWFHAIEQEGSLFGDCTCGVPRVDGIPCEHMVAVCKSKKIDGLNENNIMPLTYHTSLWRKQYPSGVSVTCVTNIDDLRRASNPSNKFMLCPAISAPRKAGRPKVMKRIKSSQELAMEKLVETKKAAKIGPHDGSKFAPEARGDGKKKVDVVMTKEVDAKKRKHVGG